MSIKCLLNTQAVDRNFLFLLQYIRKVLQCLYFFSRHLHCVKAHLRTYEIHFIIIFGRYMWRSVFSLDCTFYNPEIVTPLVKHLQLDFCKIHVEERGNMFCICNSLLKLRMKEQGSYYESILLQRMETKFIQSHLLKWLQI